MRRFILVLTCSLLIFLFNTRNTNASGLIDTILLGPTARPVDIAVNDITNKIYVADAGRNEVVVIGGLTNNIIKRISVEGTPLTIGINKKLNRVYTVSNKREAFLPPDFQYRPVGTLTDGTTDTLISSLALSFLSSGQPIESASIVVNEETKRVIVGTKIFKSDVRSWIGAQTCFNENLVVSCATLAYRVFDNSPMFIEAAGIDTSIDPLLSEGIPVNIVDKREFWFRLVGQGYDSITQLFCGSLGRGLNPRTLTSNNSQKEVVTVDIDGQVVSRKIASISPGKELTGSCRIINTVDGEIKAVAIDEQANNLFLARSDINILVGLDLRSGVIGFTIDVGIDPVSVDINDSTHRVYVANAGDGSISVVDGRFVISPIVFLPGILGSWTDNFFEPFVNSNPINQNQLSLTEESQSWFWRQLDALGFLPHTWELPKSRLPAAGFSVYKCPYDWRLNNADIARQYLILCIDKAKQEAGASKVNIIAHSMGGLVARSYIQDDSLYRNDVDKFVMLGTPNHGSANAYYPWEGADFFNGWFSILGDVLEKTVTDRLTKAAIHLLRVASVNYIHSFFPSVQELLPTAAYLRDETGSLRNISDLVWQNTFLTGLNSRSNISRLVSDPKTKIFAGEGYETREVIKVVYPNPDNPQAYSFLLYPDGKPIAFAEEKTVFGDKTVLSQKSAKVAEVNVPFEAKAQSAADPESFLEHTNLPNAFFGETLSFLGGPVTSTEQFSPTIPKEIIAISLASPADLLITDSQGRRLGFDSQSQSERYEIPKGVYSGRDELELAAIVDPQPGEYLISIIGNGEGEFATGISYAKEGCGGSLSRTTLEKPELDSSLLLS